MHSETLSDNLLRQSDSVNVMPKCQPNCTCKRHSRVISDEHRQNIAAANAARKGESHSCPEGCTCGRHQAYYRGGSKKGRTFSDSARKNISAGALSRQYTDEERARLADRLNSQRVNDPEWESRRIAAMQEALQALRGGQSSKAELLLAPPLLALGYAHNQDKTVKVGRKIPDFVDVARRRVFEFFGTYWHKPSEEQERIDYYQSLGWECEVLWERDLASWLSNHRETK